MIVSRSLNIANIVTALIGTFLATMIGRYYKNRKKPFNLLTLGIILLSIYILYLAWTPFNFVWNPSLFRKALPSPIELLPLYHYAMGSSLNHVRLFLQNLFLPAILIYLLRLRFSWFEKNRYKTILAIILTGSLGILQEGGQIFLPTRTPAMTDIYCFIVGGILGLWPTYNKKFLHSNNEPAFHPPLSCKSCPKTIKP